MNSLYFRFNRFLERHAPTKLLPRSLLIMVTPIVLLQTIMAGFILDRHWDNVTKVLGRSLASEIGLLTDQYDRSDKSEAAIRQIELDATKRLNLGLEIERNSTLPPPINRTIYSLVDDKMTKYLERETGRPFWIDSTAGDNKVDIRIEVEKGLIFRILTDEERAYASNTAGLLLWMLVSSIILLSIAAVFLRNQINPIVELSKAAKRFGMGRDVSDFRPRGAAEVREAGVAFMDMQQRISRHVEQRTAMLAGVSHDLRTILTRFKLEIAFLGDGPKVKPLKEDVDEMQRMLEGYIAFVRGDGGEKTETVNLQHLVSAISSAVARGGSVVTLDAQDVDVKLKPNSFRRLISNLLVNAIRYSKNVIVKARIENRMLTVMVDDDGPGIAPESREEAFRPFVRLDNARNMDESGTGLGLAIALDIAHAHGGEITLDESPQGGLRAVVTLPV
jgi:two-component system, OmpR family, osmolarity sensor histidine kinase EnvZ